MFAVIILRVQTSTLAVAGKLSSTKGQFQVYIPENAKRKKIPSFNSYARCQRYFFHREPVHNNSQEFQTEPIAAIGKIDTKNVLDESSNISSDPEDFFGFNSDDLKTGIFNTKTRGLFATELNSEDPTNSGSKIEPETNITGENPSDPKDIDDEIIFVENTVEVIEIDDDDDDEVVCLFSIHKKNHGIVPLCCTSIFLFADTSNSRS